MTAPYETRLAQRRTAGGWLMVVGGLVAALCGLCTLGIVGLEILYLFEPPGDGVRAIVSECIFGGIPTTIGVAIFLAGRRLVRSSRDADKGVSEVFR